MLNWRPIAESPKESCGWFAAAVNPVNADESSIAQINWWRQQFGFTKVWYNASSPGGWWEPDPHGDSMRPIASRMTHWAELPPVPDLLPPDEPPIGRPEQLSITTCPVGCSAFPGETGYDATPTLRCDLCNGVGSLKTHRVERPSADLEPAFRSPAVVCPRCRGHGIDPACTRGEIGQGFRKASKHGS